MKIRNNAATAIIVAVVIGIGTLTLSFMESKWHDLNTVPDNTKRINKLENKDSLHNIQFQRLIERDTEQQIKMGRLLLNDTVLKVQQSHILRELIEIKELVNEIIR